MYRSRRCRSLWVAALAARRCGTSWQDSPGGTRCWRRCHAPCTAAWARGSSWRVHTRSCTASSWTAQTRQGAQEGVTLTSYVAYVAFVALHDAYVASVAYAASYVAYLAGMHARRTGQVPVQSSGTARPFIETVGYREIARLFSHLLRLLLVRTLLLTGALHVCCHAVPLPHPQTQPSGMAGNRQSGNAGVPGL